MLNLSTLEPTTRQTIHTYSLEVLSRQIQAKFAPSIKTIEVIISGLQKLPLTVLDALFVELVRLENLQQLRIWLDKQLADTNIKDDQPHLERVKQHIETLQHQNPDISSKNRQALALLKTWCDEPDELGNEWWDSFEAELHH